jgi:hypothetical protein
MGLYLNNDQYYQIIKLVRNKKLLPNQRKQINSVLFKSHNNYAIKQSLLFKKKHFYKCNRIPKDEIILYGKTGLLKAVEKYNGMTNFTYFANLYINYELKNAISDAYSLSILPRHIRKKSKKNYTQQQMEEYIKLMEVDLRNNVNHWKDKNIETDSSIFSKIEIQDRQKKIWDFINKLEPSIARYANLKYNYEFQEIRSNTEISHLMCCSLETVRKKKNLFKSSMIDLLPSNYIINNSDDQCN